MKYLAAFVLLLAATGTASAQLETPDLKAGKVHVNRVVLLPVRANMVKLDYKAGPLTPGDPMEAESRQVEQGLGPIIVGVLRKLGCTVDDSAYAGNKISANPDLADSVKVDQTAFELLLFQIEQNSKAAFNNHVGLGDEIAKLPGARDTDAFIFVQVHGVIETKGKKINNFFNAGLPTDSGWHMQIGVVDSMTGTILYLARPNGSSDLVKEPEKSEPDIEKSFKNFAKENVFAAGAHKP